MIYSFSSIQTYLQCPLRFEAQYIARRVKDEGSEASRHGDRVHKQIELYVKGESDEVPVQAPKDNLLDLLRRAGADAEMPVAITSTFETVDFWDKRAMLRGKLDIRLQTPRGVVGVDWKTGKMRDNTLQGRFYAAMLSAYHPETPIQIVFDYLEKGRKPPITYKPEMRDEVLSLVEMVDGATAYPPRPTPLCGWCPVTDCKHNTKEKRK